MKDVTDKNFGAIIAFLLPGFFVLWGLAYSFPEIWTWLVKSSGGGAPSIGGFLYATLASLALGLIISAVRWMIMDTFLHRVTRVDRPELDFGKLTDKDVFAAFQAVVENHYRYYQYYSNTFVSVSVASIAYLIFGKDSRSCIVWVTIIFVCFALLLASRDCLAKYYSRAEQIIAPVK